MSMLPTPEPARARLMAMPFFLGPNHRLIRIGTDMMVAAHHVALE